MKILSYNVNGIRAAINKGFLDWLRQEAPDVLCLQETKATQDQIAEQDFLEIQNMGYQTHFFSAQKKGYSGVAIFSKINPSKVTLGSGILSMDQEGRIIRLDFEDFSVMSLYLPSGTNLDRLDFKLNFCQEFTQYVLSLQKTLPHLIICGDYNICHQEIDIHNPVSNKNTSGFLPVERAWFGEFLEKTNFVDSFRHLHPTTKDAYSWWSYRANARANNKGWRIDYVLLSQSLASRVNSAFILQQAKHSDHCPVGIELK
ncbi:MAG: exodeoxyribonuclease III [Flavobacteriaceae bacterium]|nr:MAG: exodeoxyribonuclease III [Flavobacteriaceae bacterium]